MKSSCAAVLLASACLCATAAFAAPGEPYCSLPGELVSEDATGDATTPVPGHDVLEVRIAEMAGADGFERLFFSIKVDPLAQAATPQSRYYVNFMLSDGIERWARYTPYPMGPVATVFTGADQMWSYGHTEVDPATGGGTSVTDGTADEEMSSVTDGTITIALPTDALPFDNAVGDVITEIRGEARVYYAAGTIAVDASDTAGAYVVRGSASCAAESKALLGVGALPSVTLLGLLAALARRRRHSGISKPSPTA